MHNIHTLPPLHQQYLLFPCTHTALAKAYGITRKVLYKRLNPSKKEIGKRSGYKYSLEQLFTIVIKLGWPPQSHSRKAIHAACIAILKSYNTLYIAIYKA